jgi:hypothetical protein
MIYTLFIWTIVAAEHAYTNVPRQFYDWRPIATVEPNEWDRNADKMLAKCEDIARQLNIAKERYRCIRTK